MNAMSELSELLGLILDEASSLEEKLSVQERWNYGYISGEKNLRTKPFYKWSDAYEQKKLIYTEYNNFTIGR